MMTCALLHVLMVVLVTELLGKETEAKVGEPVVNFPTFENHIARIKRDASQKFIDEVIDFHNEMRLKHQVGPLTMDQALTDTAQDWANYLLQHDIVQHNPDRGNTGENIAYKWTANPDFNPNGTYYAKFWYDEEKYYTDIYGREPTWAEFSKSGHFTQEVWKASTEIGVGMATDGCTTYVVANYYPPGNIMGLFKDNVLRPVA